MQMRLIPLALVIGLILLFAASLLLPKQTHDPLEGRPLPEIRLADAGQKFAAIDSSEWKGGPVVVNIFASWCAPCIQEWPLLLEMEKEPGLRMIGIAWQDDKERLREFLAQQGNPFDKIGWDAEGGAAIALGVTGIPESFLIGPGGTIIDRHRGPLTPKDWQRWKRKLQQWD